MSLAGFEPAIPATKGPQTARLLGSAKYILTLANNKIEKYTLWRILQAFFSRHIAGHCCNNVICVPSYFSLLHNNVVQQLDLLLVLLRNNGNYWFALLHNIPPVMHIPTP
jgi:hypothetical protein